MDEYLLATIIFGVAGLLVIPIALFARWLELKFDVHGERGRPAE